jgi:hypothetical protein
MMQDRAILTLGNWGFGAGWSFGLACALSAACAGGDTPPTDTAEQLVAVAYAGGTVAQAGSTGMGTGGSSSGTGGSTSQPSNGGSTSGGAGGGSAGTGAVSTGGTAGPGSTAGGCDGFKILQTSCGMSSCHGGPSGGFLSGFAASEAAAATYAGEQSMTCAATDNAEIFNPDNPASSLVIKKIEGSSGCGSPMPLGSAAGSLSDEDMDCIEEWISNL